MTTRPFYWSVRRELWENRYLYIAPLVVAAVLVPGFALHASGKLPATTAHAVAMPYSVGASFILFACWVIAFFYAVESLAGERRDRSILFWKSMPVSDLATVASKAFIALVVMPMIACLVTLAMQFLVLLVHTAVFVAKGGNTALLWEPVPAFVQMAPVMFYGMALHTLWFAPIFGYLLLVSSWARRAPLLWAIVLPFAIYVFERIAFDTSRFGSVLRYRFMGAMTEGFAPGALKVPITQVSQLDPARFFSNPNLWLGLVFAAACFALAVMLRRRREPT
jgi:ABC-2 type transport system permease protein